MNNQPIPNPHSTIELSIAQKRSRQPHHSFNLATKVLSQSCIIILVTLQTVGMSDIGNTTPVHVSKAEQAVRSASKAMRVAVGAELETAPVKQSGKAHEFADSIKKLVVKDGIASIGTGLLRVDIKMPVAKGSPVRMVNGMIVYPMRDSSFIVQSTEEGMRVLSVIESPTADHSVDYTLNLPKGIVPKLRDDGGVYLALPSSGAVDGPTVHILTRQ